MASKRLRILYTDGRGPVEVIVGPRAQVEVERHFGMAFTDMAKVEQVYFMAWAAVHYAGGEPRSFESFLDVIEDVEPVKPVSDKVDEQGEGPTQPVPSPAASSS